MWSARAADHEFQWVYDLGGYYNYLARGFAKGHLYADLEPSPKLLALPDPYAESVDESLKVHDMVLWRGRYYLYHGVTPEVLFFLPWRLLAKHDVPENFAVAMFCLAGFLFSTGALLRVLALEGVDVSPGLLAVLLLALAVCQDVPFLLSRVWVYEVAIACGYCCLMGAIFFLIRAIGSARAAAWLAASGLMFGLTIGCRPHLGLAAIVATSALAMRFVRRKELGSLLAFVAPLAAVGVMLAVYNYQRFGNPFDFGVRHLLGNPSLSRTQLSGGWVLPGLYYFLVCPPDFSPVFPWIRLAFRYPFHREGYFLEPTTGCLYLAPFLIGLLWARRAFVIALIAGVGILLFVAGTGFTTQRYEVDFLPLLVLIAATAFATAVTRRSGWTRRALVAAFAILVVAGAVTNMALGITGPYDDLLKSRPKSYERIAGWFSPISRYRPMLNPPVDIAFTAICKPQDDGFREPLLSIGQRTFRVIVGLEHHPGKFRVFAQSDTSTAAQEIDDPGTRALHFRIAYKPESRTLTVNIDGRDTLTQQLQALFTAPAQITVGENYIDPDVTAPVFTGRIDRALQ